MSRMSGLSRALETLSSTAWRKTARVRRSRFVRLVRVSASRCPLLRGVVRLSDYTLGVVVPITTAGEFPCSSQQSWKIENTDSANSIFVNENNAPSSAVATQGTEVPAGQSGLFFFDPKENPIIYMIAATAAVSVNIRKETFRSRFLFGLARLAAGISFEVATQFLARVSATVVKLRGDYTEFRADRVRNKNAGTGLGIYTDAAATGIALRPGT